MPRLVLETGEEKGQVFELTSMTVIGRLASCDIPIKDRKSSRNNTKVFLEAGAYFVEDMKSSNGTFLNDKKVGKSPLRNGDRITIGTTTMRFEAGSAPPKPQAAGPEQTRKPPPRPSEPVKKPTAKTGPAPSSQRSPAAAGPAPKAQASSPAPAARETIASIETPPAGIPFPAAKPAAPPVDHRAKIASYETPPEGVQPPVSAFSPDAEAGEEVEELELGGDDETPDVELPAPPSAAPAPEKPKAQLQFRVPIRAEAKSRGGNLFFQDVSQRSAGFRAVVYLAALGIMAFLGYLAFKLASGAF